MDRVYDYGRAGPNHVWSYDFLSDRTHEGRPQKILTVVDECTRECLGIVVEREIQSIDALKF
jgi:putative transposase